MYLPFCTLALQGHHQGAPTYLVESSTAEVQLRYSLPRGFFHPRTSRSNR
jgi:hypothetical protein